MEALLNEYLNDGPGLGVGEPNEGAGNLAQGPARSAERRQADDRRTRIADEMWQQYQAELHRRNIL